MADPIWQLKYMIFSVKLWKLSSNSLRNIYSGVFEVADFMNLNAES